MTLKEIALCNLRRRKAKASFVLLGLLIGLSAVARAIVNEPPILLADEPTGNLDTKTSGEVMSLLRGLNQQGMTIVMVTHSLENARHAHRILRVSDGLLVEEKEKKGGMVRADGKAGARNLV